MAKSLEQIKAEIAAEAAPVKRSIQDMLNELANATGVPIDSMLAALDSAAPDIPELLPDGARVYYTSFPNCGIMVQTGPASVERIEFKGARLVTLDAAVIAYLDLIADKPGSTIYTKSNQQVSTEVEQMRAELRDVAQRSHARMLASGEKTA